MKLRIMTYTAVMLAITLAFQSLRFFPAIAAIPWNNYLIGTLVNFSLLTATGAVGLSSGIFISIATPLVAFLQGYLPFVVFIPVVAAGNAILCVLFYYVRKINNYAGGIVASVVKWMVLSLSVQPVLSWFITLPPAKLTALTASFGLPQLITALLGSLLAILLLERLKKHHA
ncbi:MAG: ECF transporter S component [Clostridia bacterium]|nr:ECF transporter S component [Clostridia bacterium]